MSVPCIKDMNEFIDILDMGIYDMGDPIMDTERAEDTIVVTVNSDKNGIVRKKYIIIVKEA